MNAKHKQCRSSIVFVLYCYRLNKLAGGDKSKRKIFQENPYFSRFLQNTHILM